MSKQGIFRLSGLREQFGWDDVAQETLAEHEKKGTWLQQIFFREIFYLDSHCLDQIQQCINMRRLVL